MYIKYPSTPFLPWARPDTDGRNIQDLSSFEGHRVIVTEKMDGENTSMYNDHIHARSLDSANHPSRNYVKGMWGQIRHEIQDGWRVCGENMYAKHSVYYDNLESYFLGFSVWNREMCLDWDTTVWWFDRLGVTPVPVLYDGIYDPEHIKTLWEDDGTSEGYVVRAADAFFLKEFGKSIAKFVRKNHVQTDQHWMKQEIVPNQLRSNK